MQPHNSPSRRALPNLTSYLNVTGILPIEKEEVCPVIEDEPLPTESSNKHIPFVLDPKYQKPCKYGLACTRVGCLFQHPSDVPIDTTEPVDQDVYLSYINPNAGYLDILALARPYGKVLGIAIQKSKRSDGFYSCNVHFLGVEPAMKFIEFIEKESKIKVIIDMRAKLNGPPKPIDLPGPSPSAPVDWRDSSSVDWRDSFILSASVDWRDSLKNKTARMLQQTRIAPVRSSAVKIINPDTMTEIHMPLPPQPVQKQTGKTQEEADLQRAITLSATESDGKVYASDMLTTHLRQNASATQSDDAKNKEIKRFGKSTVNRAMPQQPKQQQPVQKRLLKDADGFTPVGRNSRPIYAALEIEGDDDDKEEDEKEEDEKEEKEDEELCLEENEENESEEDEEPCLEENESEDEEELCLEENDEDEQTLPRSKKVKEQDRATSSSGGTSSGASPFTVSSGPKLMSWYDMMQMQEDANKKAFGVRSFASLFKAVDASDIDAQAAPVTSVAQDASEDDEAPLATLLNTDQQAEDFDVVDNNDDAFFERLTLMMPAEEALDPEMSYEIDDLEDDHVFAANAKKLATKR
jgi:hypothetical protein